MNVSRLPILPIISALLRHKTSAIIIIAQIALTLAIVSNALFITQERVALIERDTGLDEDVLFTITVSPNKGEADPIRDLQAIRAVPGVENVTLSDSLPLSGGGSTSGFRLTTDNDPNAKSANASIFFTEQHFVYTAGLELVAGRNFNADEVTLIENQRQLFSAEFNVIVTQAFADALFENGDAIGKTIYQGPIPAKIIGIVKTLHGYSPKWGTAERTMLLNHIVLFAPQKYLIRTNTKGMLAVMEQTKQALRTANPKAVISEPKKFSKMKNDYYSRDYLLRNVLMTLVVALLMITALGIIGMTLFNINRRIKQIGTRRALGASKQDIVLHFMLENLILLFTGIVLGIALAIGLNNQLIQYFEVAKLPVEQLLWALLAILFIGQAATFWPALRAANISPAIATRTA
ncbi:hypothetical protein C2869_09175 [Saccharobesus litoralis]|uniref:ABC transport system permease protein n=1 Tax=Saccharobesus litoralis TaxID=2172099 RepID=A0A2S0VR87_9ALTE|nr:FtsX-like permease family protein [Saccharobesus litoralis]AWB66590.1 hypothetical protein C2869_09175 [Saccharobesus litoralis]